MKNENPNQPSSMIGSDTENIVEKANQAFDANVQMMENDSIRSNYESDQTLDSTLNQVSEGRCEIGSTVINQSQPAGASSNELNHNAVRPPLSRKKAIILIASAICAVVLIFITYTSIRNANYEKNLRSVYSYLYSASYNTQEAGSLTASVWKNTIYKTSSSETDAFTQTDGYFHSDFNTSVNKLYADSSFQADIASIQSDQKTIEGLMKKLKNPPSKYADTYNILLDTYDDFLAYSGMVIDPTGTCVSYRNNLNDYNSSLANNLSKLKLYIPGLSS